MNPDALAGGSGWVGAGLLGLVLSWVFFKHLPDVRMQINEIIAANLAHVKNLHDRHEIHYKEQSIFYEKSLEQILDHCKMETKMISKDIELMSKAVNKLTELKLDEKKVKPQ